MPESIFEDTNPRPLQEAIWREIKGVTGAEEAADLIEDAA